MVGCLYLLSQYIIIMSREMGRRGKGVPLPMKTFTHVWGEVSEARKKSFPYFHLYLSEKYT